MLYKPAASVRAQYKLIHIWQKKSKNIPFPWYTKLTVFIPRQPGSTGLGPSTNFCDEQSDLFILMNEN